MVDFLYKNKNWVVSFLEAGTICSYKRKTFSQPTSEKVYNLQRKTNLHGVMQREQLTYALDCHSSLFVWWQHFSMHRAPLVPIDVMLLLEFATLSFV